ncbi:MAG: hypothetical protein ACR2PV_00530, partial [Gammaproteobacteria bacterium]
ATLTPTDADGAGFQYAIDTGKDQHWLFDIGTDGVLSLKYNLDYESAFWVGNVVKTTIWGHGTTGDPAAGVGDGTAYLPHEFTLTIGNLNEDIVWADGVNTNINTTFNEVDGGFGNVAVGNYTALDPDNTTITYGITGDAAAYFSITSDGTLWAISNIDYEKAPAGDRVYAITVTAESGGDTITASLVWNLNNINDSSATWSGTPTTNYAISETDGVTNQGELTEANYKAIATFKPLDADGDGFEYAIDQSKDGWWLFDYDTSTGILSLKYNVDYESTNFPPVVETTLWLNGTTGGNGVGAGAVWISHNFTLSILDMNDPNQNDQPTTWSGTVPTSLAVSETAEVNNGSALTTATYEDLVTFTPLDDDGTNFNYFIAGEQAWLFDIGTDGVLKLKYQLDYES